MNIKCHCLFDITRTNSTRKKFSDNISAHEQRERSQQANFETLLQVINMRSQPEIAVDVNRAEISLKLLKDYNFGYLLPQKYSTQPIAHVWTFTFTVEHIDVFNNGIDDLGILLADCDGVPMITNLDETFRLPQQLNITPELRNIYFEVIR